MSRSRRGFTLVELLVVVAIIALLLTVTSVAVQQARESARGAQCRNNLRQMGIALANYHNTHQMFPPGCVGINGDPVNIQGWGWAVFLLPYVEQEPLYDALNPNQNSLPDALASAQLQPLLRTPIPLFRCPSDVGDELQSGDRTLSGFVLEAASQTTALRSSPAVSARDLLLFACINPPASPDAPIGPTTTPSTAPEVYGVRAATSNYVASFGDNWSPDGSADSIPSAFVGNGVFGSNVSVRLGDITDGTSQTFAIGERGWQTFASIWAGTDGWDRCAREGVPMVLATTYYQMNAAPEPYYLSCDPKGAAGFGSSHPKGAHFLNADGSVRFVAENINFANSSSPAQLGVFQRLSRRDDGRPVSDF